MRAFGQRRYGLVTCGLSLVIALLTLGGDSSEATRLIYVLRHIDPAPASMVQIWPTTEMEPRPSATPSSQPPPPEQPRNERPTQYQPPPPPAPAPNRPKAKTPQEAVAAAVTAGRSRGVRVGVAVLDLHTGAFYGGGDVNGQFASASVMKVFIATRLLVDGRANDPSIRSQMWQMIVASDDDAARNLYRLVGTESLIPWVAARYHLTGLAPANVPYYWGLTRITARATVNFYAAVANDTAVAPWLLSAMARTQATAADGFRQYFGIPSAASQWRVKQGWMCCLENRTRMHSTGYVNDRYAVAMLTEGSRSVYGNYGAQTLTLMARALLPSGTIPQLPQPAPPAPPPSPSPSPTPSPSSPPEPTPSPTSPVPTEPPPTTPSPSPAPP